MVRGLLDLVAELLLLFREGGLEDTVRSPDGLAIKQAVDLFKRDTAGLRDEEEGEEECQERQCSEKEIHAVVHCGEHLFSKAGDEEVKEPVTRSGGGLSQGTEIGVEEFLMSC